MKAQVKLIILALILILSNLTLRGQIDKNYEKNLGKAYAAKSVADCQASLKFSKEVQKIIPNHLVQYYLSARLNAQLGNSELALKQLKKATKLGYTTKMLFNEIHHLNDTAFNTLRDKKEFKEIIKALKESEKSVHKSQIAFIINEKELNPEGICYDPIEKMFYLGSMNKHKIIKVDAKGNSTDFTKEKQDGLGELLGIHIDSNRRILWAVSSSEKRNEIFKFNLSSGKLIKKYFLPPTSDGKKPRYNDLVIHPAGDIYISGGCSIYTIPASTDKLGVFLTNKSFFGFNGITLANKGKVIYVSDYYFGIYKIDIKTKSFKLLTHEPGFNLFGVDGLYFKNEQLYAVQDGVNTIDRFSLNETGTHVKSCEFFERNSKYLYYPTTGVIVNDYFYFIADTQAKTFDKKGVVIMKVSIN